MNQEEIDYWAGVKEVVPPNIEYRIHYNELGEITACSMIDHPDSAQYVITDKSTYDNYFLYKVIDGQLKKIDHDNGYCVKLEKSNKGFCVVQNHAGLIIEPGEVYRDIEYYDHRNN